MDKITLDDMDEELSDYSITMSGGAEPVPEISDGSIELATNSSDVEEDESRERDASREEPVEQESEPEPEPVDVGTEEENMTGEFILDDDDFEMVQSGEEILIKEEKVLPSYKVILGDDEQEIDIFNELVKQLPERLRENTLELKKVQRQLDHYKTLKVNHGNLDDYNNIVSARFKGNNFKPLKNRFLERNFTDSLFVPIVDSKKLIYNVETLDKEGNMPYVIEEDEIGRDNVLKRNLFKIRQQWGIANKYRKTDARHNYSYNNHIYEVYTSMEDAEYTSQSSNGFFTQFPFDTETYSSIYPDSDIMYYTKDGFKQGNMNKSIVMGDLGTNFSPPIKGPGVNITGFLRRPGGLFLHSKYPNKPLKETIEDYSPENLSGSFPIKEDDIEEINLDVNVGSNVKVCFVKEQYETDGVVKSMDDEKLIVKSTHGNDELELLRGDENVSIKNVNTNRNCFDKTMTVLRLPRENITSDTFSELLDDILPGQNEIIYGLKQDIIDRDDDVINFSEIDSLLENYNLSYDSLTGDLRKVLGELIEENNKTLVSKARNLKTEYKRFLQSSGKDRGNKGDKIELLNRKLLEEFKDYYGEYPFYNTPIDSVQERYKWLISRADQGTLLFKSVILKVYNIVYSKADTTKDKLNTVVDTLQNKLTDLKARIEQRKGEIIKEQSSEKCPSKKLVKIYNSTRDLESDNGKEVEVDENLETKLPGGKMVKIGDLCVLDENGEKRVFIRSLVGDKPMWTLDDDKNIDDLIISNKDYCNFQGKILKDIDNSIYKDANRCKFSDNLDGCIDIQLYKLVTDYNNLSEKVEEKRRILLIINDSGSIIERLQSLVESLKKTLKLREKLSKKMYKQREKDAVEIDNAEKDREYADLYNKIDKYLTKINTLPDEKMYPLLMELVNKYGRDADEALGENPKNVYCKMGSKVITCKHHVYMADYFRNPGESTGILNFVKDKFCIDGGDQFYCMNCGQQVYIADYETVEGFEASGAYQTTTEVMTPDDEDEIEARVNETVATINAYLDADNDSNPDLDVIIKLFSVFQKEMGMKVTEEDEKLIVSMTLELNRENVKDKDDWLAGQNPKKIPKNKTLIDTVYKNYQTRSIILNFSSVFFVVVQSAEKSYKITKSHSKCIVSLRGIPLEDRGTAGIDYITCILESMRDTNSGIFKSISKKYPITNDLTKLVNKIAGDTLIKSRIMNAQVDREDIDRKDTVNDWVQFRPPLNSINVALENLDINPESVTDKNELKETMLLMSLKGMENINNRINESDVDNLLYDPVPLDNTCCKTQITNDLNYNQYFDDNLTKITKSLREFEQKLAETKNRDTKITIDIVNKREKLPRFDKDILPENKEELDISNLNANFITSGENIGKRRLFDKNGICQLSGESRRILEKQPVSVQDYNRYSDNLNKTKLFKPLKNVDVPLNKEILNALKLDNKMIRENGYIMRFIDRLIEITDSETDDKERYNSLETLYSSLDEQIITEIDELSQFITPKKSQFQNYIEFLNNLGDFTNLHDEMNEKMNFEEVEEVMSNKKEKYIKRLFKNLRNTLNKISYGEVTDSELTKKNIPKSWKIQESYSEKLVFNITSSQKIIGEFKSKISQTFNGESIFKNISDIVDKLTFNLDTLTGKPHILNCDGEILYYSELTSKITSRLLHFLFILLLNNITTKFLTIDTDNLPDILSKKLKVNANNTSEETSDETNSDELEGDEFSLEVRKSVESQEELVVDFLMEYLKGIKRDYDLIDKHTDSYINKTIAKKSDEEKEQNLKFIEDLDRETRASFKVMLMTGLDSWKNLAAKDKSLYFGENVIEDNDVPINSEETDRVTAANQLGISGEELTEEKFQEWKNLRDSTLRESNQAFLDREIMPDDDGDYDNEHEGY